ncbi:MAG: DUF262 domain-containing protein [Chloroflexi bacterium]|nr:DUF262 domain-containing protein [Chloroflexota bacterium]
MVTRLPSPTLDDDLPTEDTEPTDASEPVDVTFRIASYPADYTLRVLNDQITNEQLVLPHFQRGYVWNAVQASRLVESFLLGLPVPEVFLYTDRNTEQKLVVDGQQRLGTIAAFYRERFENDRIFRLRGVDSRWEGKTYTDLSDPDKRRFDNSPLRSIVIQQLDPQDHSSIYLTFERLNTGGTRLRPMEIRRVQFSHNAYPFLEDLNELDSWRLLIGASRPHARLKDVELVLRVLALATNRDRYKKPLRTFLNDFMAELDVMKDSAKSSLKQSFERACDVANARLGERPFHVRRPLNVAALDSVLGVLLQNSQRVPADLDKRYDALLHDNDFLSAIESATSDEDSVARRFARATASLVE